MLQTIEFRGARQADAKASFFRYETCNAGGASQAIRVRADGNDLGLFLPGDYVNLPVFATRWEVIPATATATGTFRLGVGNVGSSRLTGVVSVVDANRDDVLAGKSFTITSLFGGTAATFAGVGVWNPAGSGRVATVSDLDLSVAASSTLTLGLTNVAPTTLDSGTNNKLLGGAAATVNRGYQEYLSATPAGFTRNYVWVGVTAVRKTFARPFLIPPGFGLIVINSTAAQSMTVNMELTEELQ
jgi:hypothetical protein